MRRILIFIVVAAVLSGIAGCANRDYRDAMSKSSNKGQDVLYNDSEDRIFIDSTGREVRLPQNVCRIAVTGAMAQMMIYSLAPEMLVGWCTKWNDGAQKYIPEEYLRLPVLGQLYGGRSELNLEELLAVNPDVVVDVGESKGSVAEDMDDLSKQTGIPFVHIEATTHTMGEAYRKLGELTGLSKRAEEYAIYCEDTYGRIADIMNRVGEEGKIRCLYCLGDSGCNVIARGSYQSEIIDMITDNIAVVDNPSAKGTGNEADLEQILAWNPDFIIFAPDSVYDTAASDPTWQKVQAIRSGNFVKVPTEPYNWLGFPPSVQRYLGMMWLTATLYPAYCDYDLETEIKDYYRMFYHIELTDEQYDELMAYAMP